MLKKILAAGLAVFIFTAVSGVNAFALSSENEKEKSAAAVKSERKITESDFTKPQTVENASLSKIEKSAYSRGEYEKQKAQRGKFSTTTKVLIGVGIAAAVVGIVVFAASRDKIRTF